MTDPHGFKAPPISGYQDVAGVTKELVNINKEREERLLRIVEEWMKIDVTDKRWLAIARTHFEQGFMAMNRALFNPKRISLPEDSEMPGHTDLGGVNVKEPTSV